MEEYRFNRLLDFAHYLEDLAKQREMQALQARTRPKDADSLTREKFTLRNVAMMVRRLEIVEFTALQDTLEGIRAALDTDETGTNLIEVARAACEAERKLAAQESKVVPFKKKGK